MINPKFTHRSFCEGGSEIRPDYANASSGKNLKFRQSGFTILEILIAVIIIGVLVAIAIPRYTQRTDNARYTTARSEMLALAKAEQAVELDTGYYVSLRVLNDVHGSPQVVTGQNYLMGWWEYSIEIEQGYAIDTSGAYADGGMGRPVKYNYDLAGDWNGPYMQFKQKGPQGNLLGVYTNDTPPLDGPWESSYGIPVDPWGNPYRLYGPYYTNAFNPGALNPDPQLTAGFNFDRFVIVSFGKNTTRDFDRGAVGYTGDDIIVPF